MNEQNANAGTEAPDVPRDGHEPPADVSRDGNAPTTDVPENGHAIHPVAAGEEDAESASGSLALPGSVGTNVVNTACFRLPSGFRALTSTCNGMDRPSSIATTVSPLATSPALKIWPKVTGTLV